jgi:hypothetical protein
MRRLPIYVRRNFVRELLTVKQLIAALQKFPLDAKVFYEMGPNGAGTIGKAQYVKVRGEGDQLGCCWTANLITLESARRPLLQSRSLGKEKPHIRRGYIRLCKGRLPGLPSRYRLPDFASAASAAESFRSRCGSVRGAPVCSSQASPTAAPQVVQGTDSICFGVSSFVFTTTSCTFPIRENAQY